MRASDPALAVRWIILLLSVHALAMLLAFAFSPLGPIMLFAPLAAIAAALRAASWRVFLAAAMLTHIPLWLVLCGWMLTVSPVGGIFVPPVLTALTLLPYLAVRSLLRHGRWSKRAMLLPAMVVLGAFEVVRAEHFLGGYPWFLQAHALAFHPLLVQHADLFGAPFVSVLALTPALALADFLRAGAGVISRRAGWSSVITASACMLFMLGYGTWRTVQTPARTTDGPLVVAVQTNLVEMKARRTVEDQVGDLRDFVELTLQAVLALEAEGRRPDVVAWPETMLPGIGLEAEIIELMDSEGYGWPARFAGWIRELQEIVDVPLLVGSVAVTEAAIDEEGVTFGAQFNSVYLLSGEVVGRYDKVALTPFGERLPWFDAFPPLRALVLRMGAAGMPFDLEAGSRLDPLGPIADHADFLATPICFESTVSWVCRRLVFGSGGERRAVGIINVSNDAWLGRSRIARRQFVDICRFRAIETRSDVVRAANTGFSVHITSDGKLAGAAGDGRYGSALESGWLAATLRRDARVPLFVRGGHRFGGVLLAAGVVLLGLHAVERWRSTEACESRKRSSE